MTLYEIVKALQNASGNNEKQAILLAHKDDALFREYMRVVYDVVKLSYYQTKLPAVSKAGTAKFSHNDAAMIERYLSGRLVTGHAAKQWLKDFLEELDPEGQELVGYIIDRSIGANVGDKMVLTAWPGMYFIPPYMRCASMDEKTRELFGKLPYFYVQVKRDGSFAYLSTGAIWTRQGSMYPDWFVGRMSAGMGQNEVLVGEMEVYKDGKLLSRKDGNGVLNSILQGGLESEYNAYEFKYVAWDLLSLGEFEQGESKRHYGERWENLMVAVAGKQFNDHIELVQCWKVFSVAEAKKIHTNLTAQGLEGSVWKTAFGEWRDTSSGSRDAVKVKVVFDADYKIIGYYEGAGKARGMLGGITVTTSCGKLVNDCGSGFNDDDRKRYWAIREQLPGMIATLEANDITEARNKATVSLSLPIVLEIRSDKKEADSLERVRAQLVAARLGQKLSS